MSRLISLIALLAIAIVIGVVFFQVMVIFLVPMFLAVVLVIIFRPMHVWFCRRLQGRERIAAGVTTITILLIVLIPLMLVLSRAVAEGWAMVSRANEQGWMESRISRLRTTLDLELPPVEITTALKEIGNGMDQLNLDPTTDDDKALRDRHKLLRHVLLRAEVVKLWVEGHADKYRNPGFLGRWSGADETQLIASSAALIEQLKELEKINSQTEEKKAELDRASGENKDAVEKKLAELSRKFVEFLSGATLADRKIERQLLGDDLVYLLRSKANPSDDDLRELREKLQGILAPAALSVAPLLGKIFFGTLIMIVALYYFLADGPRMISAMMRLSPLDERYEQQLVNEFGRISRAVVVATLLTALVQGLLAGIGFRAAGLSAVFLLSVLTMVGAIIPFVGAAAVWIPAAAWLVFEGQVTAGAGLAAWGLLVVSTSDNFIKPWILHGQSNLHPLLALVSVLGGVVALGPIGVFVGPMAVVFLQVVLQMVNTELQQLGVQRSGATKGDLPLDSGSEESGQPPPPPDGA